jgi:hypothetical protein
MNAILRNVLSYLMKNYLTEEQLKSNLSLGIAVEQWLGIYKEADYIIIRWLRIDQERDKNYTVAYFECFDEGNEGFLDIYEFSPLNPDELYGVLSEFNNFNDALKFAETLYESSNSKYVSAGMIQKEYSDYLNN